MTEDTEALFVGIVPSRQRPYDGLVESDFESAVDVFCGAEPGAIVADQAVDAVGSGMDFVNVGITIGPI